MYMALMMLGRNAYSGAISTCSSFEVEIAIEKLRRL
jgi:hypothetical protein